MAIFSFGRTSDYHSVLIFYLPVEGLLAYEIDPFLFCVETDWDCRFSDVKNRKVHWCIPVASEDKAKAPFSSTLDEIRQNAHATDATASVSETGVAATTTVTAGRRRQRRGGTLISRAIKPSEDWFGTIALPKSKTATRTRVMVEHYME